MTATEELAALLVAEPCLTEEEARRELGLPPPRDEEERPRTRRRYLPSAQ